MPLDLDHPDCNPPDCPAWAKETVPDFIRPFRGRNGLPKPYCDRTGPLAMNVRGIDRYHANQWIPYRPETAAWLYRDYTPLRLDYRPGLLPAYESLAAGIVAGCRTQTEKLLALLARGAERVKHPAMPPCGDPVRSDRALDDEALLRSGLGWCNEQARAFARLCQVSGLPARLVQLFYADEQSGHCIAEVHADGRWCMADASWRCAMPGPDGRLLSAAQCHDRGEGQKACGLAYYRRYQEVLALTDAQLHFADAETTVRWRREASAQTPDTLARKMHWFGLINYPLPSAG